MAALIAIAKQLSPAMTSGRSMTQYSGAFPWYHCLYAGNLRGKSLHLLSECAAPNTLPGLASAPTKTPVDRTDLRLSGGIPEDHSKIRINP